jgi:hypothetical protein
MKKVAIITVVGVALLVLATGAWVVDGFKAVRNTGRRRRVEEAVERHTLRDDRHHRLPLYAPEGPERFAAA